MPPKNTVNAPEVDFTDKIWRFFTSLKLVIFLLLILSALSIAGTIIEQNKPLHEYYRFFKPDTVAFFNKIGLFDMYHSWWFTSCLALLALNIIACTMDRYRPIIAGLRKKNLVLDEALGKTLNPITTMKYALPMEKLEQNMTGLIGGFYGKPVVTLTEDGSRHYFFEKGKYSRVAFFFTHLSLLIIFIGAIIGSFFGYKGYVTLFEGETISSLETRSGQVKNLDFTVKCNSFTVDFYPNGMPKEYRSDLSIIKDGKEVVRKDIRVNDPLTFSGISFFQSSYGNLPDSATLEVVNSDGTVAGSVSAPFGKKIDLPGVQEQAEIADYQEHYHNPDGLEAGPALGVNIYTAAGNSSGIWLFERNPDYDKIRGRNYFLRIKEVRLKKFTGLQVNKDPGEWLVWLGSLLLIGGVMAAFFISHKKIWVRLRKDKKGRTEVTIGGTANKNRAAFVGEAERIMQRFAAFGKDA